MKLKKYLRRVVSQKAFDILRVGSIFFRYIVREVERQQSDGSYAKPFKFVVLDRGNCVAALVRNTQTDKLMFVRQYRAGSDTWEVELPAGMLDEGEDPGDAIDREVMEETGYAYSAKHHFKHLKLSPGGYTEEADLFYIETNQSLKIGEGGGRIQESEILEILWIDVNEAIQMEERGLITDAKTAYALKWLALQRVNM